MSQSIQTSSVAPITGQVTINQQKSDIAKSLMKQPVKQANLKETLVKAVMTTLSEKLGAQPRGGQKPQQNAKGETGQNSGSNLGKNLTSEPDLPNGNVSKNNELNIQLSAHSDPSTISENRLSNGRNIVKRASGDEDSESEDSGSDYSEDDETKLNNRAEVTAYISTHFNTPQGTPVQADTLTQEQQELIIAATSGVSFNFPLTAPDGIGVFDANQGPYRDQYQTAFDSLPVEQQRALRTWTLADEEEIEAEPYPNGVEPTLRIGDDFATGHSINEFLRDPSNHQNDADVVHFQAAANALQSSLTDGQLPIPPEVRLYRYVNYESAQNPYTNGNIQPGDVVNTGQQFSAFSSSPNYINTLGDEDNHSQNAVIFSVQTTTNSATARPFIDGISTRIASEAEYLYAQNSSFRVANIRTITNSDGAEITLVELEEYHDDEAVEEKNIFAGSANRKRKNPDDADVNNVKKFKETHDPQKPDDDDNVGGASASQMVYWQQPYSSSTSSTTDTQRAGSFSLDVQSAQKSSNGSDKYFRTLTYSLPENGRYVYPDGSFLIQGDKPGEFSYYSFNGQKLAEVSNGQVTHRPLFDPSISLLAENSSIQDFSQLTLLDGYDNWEKWYDSYGGWSTFNTRVERMNGEYGNNYGYYFNDGSYAVPYKANYANGVKSDGVVFFDPSGNPVFRAEPDDYDAFSGFGIRFRGAEKRYAGDHWETVPSPTSGVSSVPYPNAIALLAALIKLQPKS